MRRLGGRLRAACIGLLVLAQGCVGNHAVVGSAGTGQATTPAPASPAANFQTAQAAAATTYPALPAHGPPGDEYPHTRLQNEPLYEEMWPSEDYSYTREQLKLRIFHATQPPHMGYVRGDYEANNLLLLVWQPEWEQSVKRLAAAAAEEMEVRILVPRGAWHASQGLRRWARRHCVGVSFQRYDTAWIRDYGPIQFVHQGQVTWGDFSYDPERPEDDALPLQLAADFGMPIEMRRERLDGGGLVSNGRGLCVVTDATLDESLEGDSPFGGNAAQLATALGCQSLVSIGALPEEQTGHADVSVQFLAADVVAVAEMDPHEAPEQADLLDEAVVLIEHAAAELGQPMRVVRVPMIHHEDVFYSYVNAVRSHETLFVPSYRNVPRWLEQQAHRALAQGLAGLRVEAVPSDAIVTYGGALHCITLGLYIPGELRSTSGSCRKAKLHRRRRA